MNKLKHSAKFNRKICFSHNILLHLKSKSLVKKKQKKQRCGFSTMGEVFRPLFVSFFIRLLATL